MNRYRNGRVQTTEYNNIQPLRPAPIPGSTYVRPMESDGGASNLRALASAFGGMSDVLANFGAADRAEAKANAKMDIEAEFKRNLILGQEDPAVLKKTMADPRFATPRFQIMAGGVEGARQANAWKDSIAQDYVQNYDPTTDGPLDQWLAGKRNAFASDMPDNVKAGFLSSTQPFFDELVVKDRALAAQNTLEKRTEGTIAKYNQVVEDGRKQGWDDARIAQEMVAMGQALKASNVIDHDIGDKALLKIAAIYADKGDQKMVQAILNAQRGGKGSLMDDPAYAQEAIKLRETAMKNYADNRAETNPRARAGILFAASEGQTTEDALNQAAEAGYIDKKEVPGLLAQNYKAIQSKKDRLAAEEKKQQIRMVADEADKELGYSIYLKMTDHNTRGGGYLIKEYSGLPNKTDGAPDRTISEAEVQKQVFDIHEQVVAREYQSQIDAIPPDASPEERARRESAAADWMLNAHLQFYGDAHAVRPQWEKAFVGAAAAVPSVAALKANGVTRDMQYAGELYRKLKQKNSPMLRDIKMSEEDRLLFEAYDFAMSHSMSKDIGAADPAQAWSYAANIVERKAKGELDSPYFEPGVVDAAVKEATDGEAGVDMRSEVIDRARFTYYVNGGDKDAAIKQAIEAVKEDYVTVNGTKVFVGKDRTDDFADLAEEVVYDRWQRYGQRDYNGAVESADDLILVPSGKAGTWRVWRKGGMPLKDENNDDVLVTSRDINALRDYHRTNAELTSYQELKRMKETGATSSWSAAQDLNTMAQRGRDARKDAMIRSREGMSPQEAERLSIPIQKGANPGLDTMSPEEYRKKAVEDALKSSQGNNDLGGGAGSDNLTYDAPTLRKGGGIVRVPKNVIARKKVAMDFFKSKGLTTEQAAGIVGNLTAESAMNTTAKGDKNLPGGSIGIGQWNRERKSRLLAFAKANKRDWHDLETQLEYVWWELNNYETTAFKNLKNAKTVYAATAAMIGYERPLGWKAHAPERGHNFKGRLAYAQRAYSL